MSDPVTLREFIEQRLDMQRRFDAERDRRIVEVAMEREKALLVKQEADKTALELARSIQEYKDERANDLRSQIESERGNYATKHDLISAMDKLDGIIRPIAQYVASQQGKSQGVQLTTGMLFGILAAAGSLFYVVMQLLHK